MSAAEGGDLATSDERRRLDLLAMIAEVGGSLIPRRNPAAPHGHELTLPGAIVPADLTYLAERDYLQERYFDRVTVCPKCSSHFLNLREVCPACRSTHYSEEPLLHHFRCGYVGRISEFAAPDGSGKRICRKCATQLKYPGTDHDQLGRTFLCLDCGTSFQEAPVSAICLACSTETPAVDLSTLRISSYSMTSLGTAAVRRGSLFERGNESLFIAGAAIYRPHVMRERLAHEAHRCKRFKKASTLLMLQFSGDQAAAVGVVLAVLEKLRARLRGVDAIGQLADGLYAVAMAETSLKGAQVVRTHAAGLVPKELSVELSVAAFSSPDELAEILAGYHLE